MSFKTNTFGLALGAALVLGGCDSLIDSVEPRQSVTPDQALGSQEGFDALLSNAYDALQDQDYYGQQYMLVPDALADNIRVPASSSNRYPGFTQNTTGAHLTRWGGHYNTINNMNLVLSRIDGLELQAANPQAIRDRIKGEAYWFRALNYFDLVRTKAYEPGREVNGFNLGVIIRTEPTISLEDADFRARSTNVEVYNLVASDLDQATSLLTTAGRGSKSFLTKAAAHALYARVNLYRSDWAGAEAQATAALATTGATLVNAPTPEAMLAAWRAASLQESIFEIQMTASQDGGVTNVNASLQSLTDPRVPNFFDAVATTSLVNAHEANDSRLGLYVNATRSGEAITFIQKWTGTTAIYVDRIPVFRVSEMLLIRAEARAEQGNTAGALSDLNALRAARGLGAVVAATPGDIVEAILRERRVEFAFEGHRFFDLKRRGRDIPKPQTGFNVLPYTDFRILARVPQSEVELNPQLVQNPGYAD